MGISYNKEVWEAAEKFIADYEKKRAERLQSFLERHKSYESLDDILIKKFHYTQEQIDNYRFRSDRTEYDAMIKRFLSEDF